MRNNNLILMKYFSTKFGMTLVFLLSILSASAYDFEVDGIYYSVK